jgi:hypothetical protein
VLSVSSLAKTFRLSNTSFVTVNIFGQEARMGSGLSHGLAITTLTSLNKLFNEKLPATKANYARLKAVYPNLLIYADANTTEHHTWRHQTLRFAGWLLTAECDFNEPHVLSYPGKNFKKWLRWLTWLQLFPQPGSTVLVNGQPVARVPAEAIMTTLRKALDDPMSTAVTFAWHEGAALEVDVTTVSPVYSISVTSLKEPDIPAGPHDNDEDDVSSS